MSGAVKEAVGKWGTMMDNALQYDKWGQIVEAMELYTTMHREAGAVLKGVKEVGTEQRNALLRFQAVLQMRLDEAKKIAGGGGGKDGIQYEEILKIADLKGLILEGHPWPIQLDSVVIDRPTYEDDPPEDEQTGFGANNTGYILPAPQMAPGDRILKVEIEKIGLKDALDYLDPFITVSLRAGPFDRQLIEPEQITPHPKLKREAQTVHFMTPVYIQTPVDKIPPQANIFFEFKHYKPKKNKISVRCWGMLSPDELTEGSKQLEVYAKPADFTAKKFHKHSNKPLYLHVNLSILENRQ